MKKNIIILTIAVLLIIGAVGYFFHVEDIPANEDVVDVRDGSIQYDGGDSDEPAEEIVYAEVVESADECTTYEQFDPETSECFFACANESECEEISAYIDNELDQIALEYTAFSKDFQEFSGDSQDIFEKAAVVYTLEPGETFAVTKGGEDDTAKKIRRWVAAIVPDTFADAYLARVVLYNDPGADTLAFVEPQEDSQKWDLFINLDTLADGEREMVFTLIHEFAHIYTLNVSQLDPNLDEDNCETYYVQEGCFNEDAYMTSFFRSFWKDRYGKGDSQFDLERVKAYKGNEIDFVSEYAATNPGEDIAESFAQFILSKESPESTLAARKINFFYDYKEVKFIRDDIRAALLPYARARLR